MTELLTMSARELVARIRARDVSPVEVVDAHIRHIEEVNPVLNALTAESFVAARAQARLAERRLRDPAPPPLLGVPFTVKEMISVQGMPHTLGSVARRERRATRDATVIARLRAAGAILLGVSNVPEWGFWFETDNVVYGRTRNPYDPTRTPGGSSGGEGALIGAGAAPFGIGSDLGGSVRIPAAFCGVFSHKPSHGLLPLTGHWPVYEDGPEALLPRAAPHLCVGPLTRSARDLMLLLHVMAGPDGTDPNAEPVRLEAGEERSWRGRRVLLLDAPRIHLASRAAPEVVSAVRRAAESLAVRGAVVEEAPADLFVRAAELWGAVIGSQGGPSISALAGLERSSALARQLIHLLMGRSQFSPPILLFAVLERFGGMSDRRRAALVQEARHLRQRLSSMLSGGALLLMPPYPRTAPRHRRPYLRPFDFAYGAVANVLRLPATVAPMGLAANGMPLSVQILAGAGRDHLGIGAALVLEEDHGGWIPPWAAGRRARRVRSRRSGGSAL